MSKLVHILGAGGPAGVGMTRCLKEHYEVTGEDSSQWSELMMECDPGTGECDLIMSLPDSVIIEQARAFIDPRPPWTFLPPLEQITLCQDKAATAKVLGDLAPLTYWVRDTHGAGGAGAQMASEVLPGRNYSQEFVFFNNAPIGFFQKERLSYSVKSRTQGIDNRGSSAVSICTRNEEVNHVALAAMARLNEYTGVSLHGFYGIDLVEDKNGVPKVTEINAGRLLTASYAFFSETRYNLPLVGVKSFFGEDIPPLPDYPVGWGQIRQVGQLPRLFPPEVTKLWT